MARQNLCPNPALDVDLTGWNADATLTRVDVTGEGFPRRWAARRTGSGVLRSASAAVVAGTVYTVSGHVRCSSAGSGQWFITWLDASQTFIANSTGVADLPAGSVQRLSLTDAAPANAAFARFAISPPSAASTAEMTAVLIDPSATLSPYADGTTAGWSWDGAEGLSTSTEARAIQPLFVQASAILTPPQVPSISMAPPITSTVVVPVGGPVGPRGPQGIPGDPGAALGYVYTAQTPAYTHQIQHGLLFKPGGISAFDADGTTILGFSVAHPQLGVTEVSFGVAVTPTIYLS